MRSKIRNLNGYEGSQKKQECKPKELTNDQIIQEKNQLN